MEGYPSYLSLEETIHHLYDSSIALWAILKLLNSFVIDKLNEEDNHFLLSELNVYTNMAIFILTEMLKTFNADNTYNSRYLKSILREINKFFDLYYRNGKWWLTLNYKN